MKAGEWSNLAWTGKPGGTPRSLPTTVCLLVTMTTTLDTAAAKSTNLSPKSTRDKFTPPRGAVEGGGSGASLADSGTAEAIMGKRNGISLKKVKLM